MNEHIKVKILGSGPTGALLAIALASRDCKVFLFDPKPEVDLLERSRAYAVTHSSRRLLQELDIWTELKSLLIPFKTLEITDTEIQNNVSFKIRDLAYRNQTNHSIGWIIDHKSLMHTLISRIKDSKNITFQFGTSCNSDIEDNDFVFAADGPLSPSRRYWGMKRYVINYNQGCLTAKVLIRGSDNSTAYEILRHEGPFAVLPMGANIFQVVWSAPYYLCERRSKLSDTDFLDRLSPLLPNGLEPDFLIDEIRAFPVRLAIPRSLYHGRKIIVGEAAHSVHPVGGQGLNLCFRDVKCILNLFADTKTKSLLLDNFGFIYSIQRYLDILFVGIFTDLLVRLFSNRNYFLKPIRIFLFYALSRISLLRNLTLKLMTDGVLTNI